MLRKSPEAAFCRPGEYRGPRPGMHPHPPDRQASGLAFCANFHQRRFTLQFLLKGPVKNLEPSWTCAAGSRCDVPAACDNGKSDRGPCRSEEHTSELQSLMRISYAVFCLKKKKTKQT